MREIIFYGVISLNDYLTMKAGGLQWLFDTPTGKQTIYEAFYETIDTTIVGRETYQETKKYLKTEAIYPGRKNFVFSARTQLQLPDVEIINKNPIAFLKDLQMIEGKDIRIMGGGRLIKLLLEHQIIDERYIQITPVLLGDGIPLFRKGTYKARSEVLDTIRFSGFIELHHARKQK